MGGMNMPALKHASSSPQPCKICGQAAPLYGVVDFNKSCEEYRGLRLPLVGVPVYYRRCKSCGFLFTDAFDDWSVDQFKAHIYNPGYKVVDPDYETARPQENAKFVERTWNAVKAGIRVLDYGGGDGTFAAALGTKGFPEVLSFDPMVPEYAQAPEGKFDLVTSFETLEHLPDPLGGIDQMLSFVAEPGLLFFSTYLQNAESEQQGGSWWYVAPRNGHVSIFSREALERAFGRHGYRVGSLNDNYHFAFRTLPPYFAGLERTLAERRAQAGS
jgi:SAM-dependent methyltransferase